MQEHSFTPGTLLRVRQNGHMVGVLLVFTTQGMQEAVSGKPANGLDITMLVKVGDAPEYAGGVVRLHDPVGDGV